MISRKIKLINLNLWWGGRLFDKIIKFIKTENPDIITCQEVMNGTGNELPNNLRTIELFKQQLNLFDYSFAPAFAAISRYGTIDCGNLVASRFPIKPINTIFYDIPYRKRKWGLVDKELTKAQINAFINTPRNLQQVLITIDNQLLTVFNTQGIWDVHGRDNPRRLAMSEIIVQAVSNKKNLILTGDFNVNEGTQSIKNIEKQLQSVFKGELTTSFNMKYKSDPGYGQAVVDMVFISKEIRVIDHYCPRVDVSDHLPLVVIFRI